MSRYGNYIDGFENYVKSDPKADGPRLVPAVRVTEKAVEEVKKQYKLPQIKAGDYLLLMANGTGKIMSAERFKQVYTKAHTTA